MAKASETIRDAVLSWPQVSEEPHRFGGVEFRLGKREFGHLHGEVLLDVPFPRTVRDELIGAGLVERHHILPDSGWISFRIRKAGDAEAAIALLRRSYDLAIAQLVRREQQSKRARAQS